MLILCDFFTKDEDSITVLNICLCLAILPVLCEVVLICIRVRKTKLSRQLWDKFNAECLSVDELRIKKGLLIK